MGKKLGDGASADVHEAIAIQVDPVTGKPVSSSGASGSRHVAVKVFMLESAQTGRSAPGEPAKSEVKGHPDFFKAEWEMLAQLEHPHIVRMYEGFKEANTLYIVMELCHGGELIEHVKEVSRKRGRGGLEEGDARHLFRQMLYACSYLHANKIVHRDIKLENFLLVGGPTSEGASVIKLCDFGTAVVLSDRMPRAMGRIGTLSYTSPEVCADRGATVLADAWSLGVVLYVLLVGAKPFRLKLEEPRAETMRRIQTGSYNQARPGWKSLSGESRDLVKAMITVEESQRLTSTEALQHPWTLIDAPNIALAHQWGDVTGAAPHALKLLAHATKLDPLQQFVMGLCSRLISEGDLLAKGVWATWYNLFFALDTNKDGQLDFGELARGLWAVLGPAVA
jgi:serine/threonine protein kinase